MHPDLASLTTSVDAALAAGDLDGAVEAIRRDGRAVAFEAGAAFRDLVYRIPEEAWDGDGTIAAVLGASYRAPGSPRGTAALRFFEAAAATLDRPGVTTTDRAEVWLGQAAALRVIGRLDEASATLDRIAELGRNAQPSVSRRVAYAARWMLKRGMIDLQLGRFDSARDNLEGALGLRDRLSRAETMECLGALSIVDFNTGDLARADAMIAEVRALAQGTELLASGFAAPALATEVLIGIERCGLDRARQVETELLDAAMGTEYEPFAYSISALLTASEGALIPALDLIGRSLAGYRSWPRTGFGHDVTLVMQANVLLGLDRIDEAAAILADLPPYEHHLICPARVIGRLRLGRGDIPGARAAIADCLRLGDAHASRSYADVQVLHAAIELAAGDTRTADLLFDRALSRLTTWGLRTALLSVPPLLLGDLAARAVTRPQSGEVIELLESLPPAAGGEPRAVQPLTDQERRVLATLIDERSTAAIAARLYLSPNTVKTHLRHLYRKLGVTTREDAIRVARSLGFG